jgi:hypothetical protein
MAGAVLLMIMVLLGSLPGIQASTSPVELVMGGEGSRSWQAGPLEPGDRGTEEVEVRNIGTSVGYLRIWVSGIEGIDGGTDGAALAKYLRFGLSADGLTTVLDLPTTIDRFPTFPTQAQAVVVGPLGAGDRAVIQWSWEFAETGAPQNDAQGDSLTFDINYMLTDAPSPAVGYEYVVVDMLGWQTAAEVDDQGILQQDVDAIDPLGIHHLRIAAGTIVRDDRGEAPGRIVLSVVEDVGLPNGPSGSVRIGPTYRLQGYDQDGGPIKVSFSSPPTLVLGVDASAVPAGHLPMGIYVLDEWRWNRLPGDPAEASKWSTRALVDRTGLLAVFSAPVLDADARLYAADVDLALEVQQTGFPLAYSITQGRSMSMTVEVINPADSSGIFLMDLEVDGQVVETRSVVLEPLEATVVTFHAEDLEEGVHEASVLGTTIEFTTGTTVSWLPLAMLNIAWVGILIAVVMRTPGGPIPWGRRLKPSRKREKMTPLEELAETTDIANPQLLHSLDEVWEGHRATAPPNGRGEGKK